MENKTEKTEKSYLKKGGNGGKRPGSGRKAVEKIAKVFEAREAFNKRVDDRWDKLMAVMDECIENKDKDMVKFLVEQRIGKAPQSMKMEVNGKLEVAKAAQDVREILDGLHATNNSEPSEEAVQSGGRQTSDTNGEPVSDIRSDNDQEEAESLAIGAHEIREILDSSTGSANKSSESSGEMGDSGAEREEG